MIERTLVTLCAPRPASERSLSIDANETRITTRRRDGVGIGRADRARAGAGSGLRDGSRLRGGVTTGLVIEAARCTDRQEACLRATPCGSTLWTAPARHRLWIDDRQGSEAALTGTSRDTCRGERIPASGRLPALPPALVRPSGGSPGPHRISAPGHSLHRVDRQTQEQRRGGGPLLVLPPESGLAGHEPLGRSGRDRGGVRHPAELERSPSAGPTRNPRRTRSRSVSRR